MIVIDKPPISSIKYVSQAIKDACKKYAYVYGYGAYNNVYDDDYGDDYASWWKTQDDYYEEASYCSPSENDDHMLSPSDFAEEALFQQSFKKVKSIAVYANVHVSDTPSMTFSGLISFADYISDHNVSVDYDTANFIFTSNTVACSIQTVNGISVLIADVSYNALKTKVQNMSKK